MPDAEFTFWECPECEFDFIDVAGKPADFCPLCEGDTGHMVKLKGRDAVPEDTCEGYDARKPSP